MPIRRLSGRDSGLSRARGSCRLLRVGRRASLASIAPPRLPCPAVAQAQPDVPLAPLTTLRLGGPARRLVSASTEAELVAAVREADAAAEPVLVLAGGSNVVIADEGFAGTVVHVATRGVQIDREGDRQLVRAAAGEDWD